MKHGRAKAARKTLKFYSLNANIKPPFKIILDGNFLAAAMKYKVPLFERIAKMLQTNEIYFYVTRSALVELDSLPKDDNIYSDARQFGLDECEIIESSDNSDSTNNSESSPSLDIQNLVGNGNKHGYFVATQDKALSDSLRDMANVPQLWLTKGVLIFDTPSAFSRKASQIAERVKQKTGGGTMTKDESELIRRLREEKRNERLKSNESAMQNSTDERKKRKARGPNPLSCKKKKTDEKQEDAESSAKKRRRRRKSTNNNEDD